MQDYQRIFRLKTREGEIRVGHIAGSERVLFIKTGQGGSIYDPPGKYLSLSHDMSLLYGCTVFVSETLSDTPEDYGQDMRLVAEQMGDTPYEIYYMGVSKGGLIGCWYGADNPKIKRIAAVNAPLMLNFHNKTLPALQRLSPKLTLYYGTRDPSYRYVGFAQRHAPVRLIEGGDHTLQDHLHVYREIAEALLQE